MAATHKNQHASVRVDTGLSLERIGELCAATAEESKTVDHLIRLEESKPGRLAFSVRTRITGGRVEVMVFQVLCKQNGDRVQMSTHISSFKTRRQYIIVIPLPKQLIGWGAYKRFMYNLAKNIEGADNNARASVMERAA